MNKVFLIGNLTKDPELSTTNNGVKFCKFTLAVSRNYSKDGKRETDFLNVVVWRAQADNDVQVECMNEYATERNCGDNDVQVECMNEYAAADIASGIEDYFYDGLYDDYCEYYTNQIAEHAVAICQKTEEQAEKPVEAPAESPKLDQAS